MRVIEIAHVEGDPLPVLTLDGEPFSQSNSVTAHFAYAKPTQIFINGVRVTEPTRLVKYGEIVAQDNVGTEVNIEIDPLANWPSPSLLLRQAVEGPRGAPVERE